MCFRQQSAFTSLSFSFEFNDCRVGVFAAVTVICHWKVICLFWIILYLNSGKTSFYLHLQTLKY